MRRFGSFIVCHLRVAFLSTGAAWAAVAYGQTPAPPSAPGGGTSEGDTAPAEIAVPTGSGLIRVNPASPVPSPDLATGAALPAQRGFIRAEPFFIYPFVGVGYTDNLTGVNDDRISSAFLAVSPRVRADLKTGANMYALTYGGNYSHYLRSSDNDVNEHEFIARSSNQFTARADLSARAYYLSSRIPAVRTGHSLEHRTVGTERARTPRLVTVRVPHKGDWNLTWASPISDTRTIAK